MTLVQKILEKYHVIAATFKFPPKLKPFIKAPGDLHSTKNWTTKIWLNNSGEGEAQVGYIAIDVKTGMLVPIARSDEHRTGYDLLHYLERKKIIPKGKWFTIWSIGGNYVYGEEYDKEALEAFKKWREIGGPNLPVQASGGRREGGFHVSMDDFIKTKGNPESNWNGKLAPVGERVVKSFEKVAQIYAKYRKENKLLSTKPLVKSAGDLMQLLHHYFRFLGIEKEQWEKADKALLDLEGKGNLDDFEKSIFAYDGIKNALHEKIRKSAEDPSVWDARNLKEIFGDLKLAKAEFDRLGQI